VSGKLLRQRIDLRKSYADNRQTKTDQKGLPTLLAKSLDLPKHKIHLGITSTVQVQLVRAGLQMYRYTANFKVIHGEGRARQAGGKSAREIACRAAWSGPTGCGEGVHIVVQDLPHGLRWAGRFRASHLGLLVRRDRWLLGLFNKGHQTPRNLRESLLLPNLPFEPFARLPTAIPRLLPMRKSTRRPFTSTLPTAESGNRNSAKLGESRAREKRLRGRPCIRRRQRKYRSGAAFSARNTASD